MEGGTSYFLSYNPLIGFMGIGPDVTSLLLFREMELTGNAGRYPVATKVPGKTGRVISPYAPKAGEVIVDGYSSGDAIRDPYTGKIFLLP